MFVQLLHETEMKVGAGEAWKLYGSIKLPLLPKKDFSNTTLDILEGDGGIGIVIKLTVAGGFSYKEKYTQVDHERRLKETEAIEGGFLDTGISLYRVRFQVIAKDEEESESHENGMPRNTIIRNRNPLMEKLSIRVPGLESIDLDAELTMISEYDLKCFSPIPFVGTLA